MRLRVLLLALCAPIFTLAQNGFSIQGNIKGIPDNTVMELRNDDLSGEPVATGAVKAGSFQMKGRVDQPNIYVLTFNGNKQKFPIFLDNSKITIKGHVDSLGKARVTGSPSHDQFEKFNKEFTPLFEKLSRLVNKINSGAQDPGGAMRRDYEKTIDQIQAKTDLFVKAAPSSYVSPFVILVMTQLNTDVTVTEKRYNLLSPDVRNGYYGTMLAKTIADGKIGMIGSDAIDFVQNDTTGTPVSLSSFRGKYVLLDFWASWCRPCRQENPNVVEAYNMYKDKNFTVLGVSLDRAKEPWVKAINDDKLTWTQVSDLKFWSNEVAVKYKIESIPQNFLIDPNGKIIGRNLRGEELNRKLKELLN